MVCYSKCVEEVIMKINYHWNEKQAVDQVELISHPSNQEFISKLTLNRQSVQKLTLINPLNNRQELVDISEIESFQTLGHLSKVYLNNQREYFYSKILKELFELEEWGFYRVNQSTILNLKAVNSFASESHARLAVVLNNGKSYIVSRHYAQNIKERLS